MTEMVDVKQSIDGRLGLEKGRSKKISTRQKEDRRRYTEEGIREI